MTRLVLVDDQSLVQQGVATLLELTGQIEVVGRFLSGAQLLQWLDQQQEMPDLILLDFHMPQQDSVSGDLNTAEEQLPTFPLQAADNAQPENSPPEVQERPRGDNEIRTCAGENPGVSLFGSFM